MNGTGNFATVGTLKRMYQLTRERNLTIPV
jgi:hypothetical protein